MSNFYTNFITPPDYIKSVLIVDATDEQLKTVADYLQGNDTPFNVYLYKTEMNNTTWLTHIESKVDAILDAKINEPITYFNK